MSEPADSYLSPNRHKSELDDVSRKEMLKMLKLQEGLVHHARREVELLKGEKTAAKERAVNAEEALQTLSILRSSEDATDLSVDQLSIPSNTNDLQLKSTKSEKNKNRLIAQKICLSQEKQRQLGMTELKVADYGRKLSKVIELLKMEDSELGSLQRTANDLRAYCTESVERVEKLINTFEAKSPAMLVLEDRIYNVSDQHKSLRLSSTNSIKKLQEADSERKAEIERLTNSLTNEVQKREKLEELLCSMKHALEDNKIGKETAETVAVNLEKDVETFKTHVNNLPEQKKSKEDMVESTDVSKEKSKLESRCEALEETQKNLGDDLELHETGLSQVLLESANAKMALQKEIEAILTDLARDLDELGDSNLENNKKCLDGIMYEQKLEMDRKRIELYESKFRHLEDEKFALENELEIKDRMFQEERGTCAELRKSLEGMEQMATMNKQTSTAVEDSIHVPHSDKSEFYLKKNEISVDVPFVDSGLRYAKAQYVRLQNVLTETEQKFALVEEQNKTLKEELKRLHEERTRHLENVEYVKNIVLTFISPEKVRGERAQLVPILATVLKFTPEETDKLWRVLNTKHSDTSSAFSVIPRWAKTI